ncbi:MAG TPA: lipid-transfer protein [Dehalococcoidia bacterium]|nr:lipid-transfer protein [Dehalococcoidia bacterium]
MRDRTAIVGIGTTEYVKNIGRSELQTSLEAIRLALEDAGLKPAEVDAIFKVETPGEDSNSELEIARNLGVRSLRAWGAAGYGGGAACAPVVFSAMAVATGMADVAVAVRARNRGSGGRPWARTGGGVAGLAAFEAPYGLVSPVQQVALVTRRYMHESGATSEDFARVAVSQRNNASRNPRAFFRGPISIDDVLKSRMIADPLHLLDCSLETDGACALVITSAERSRDLKETPAVISGVAQGMPPRHYMMNGLLYQEDPFDLPSLYAARDVYRMAGMGPGDVDVALFYDVFSPMVLWQLEAYGFCERGDGKEFVRDGRIDWPDGELPVNTHGGSLSEAYVHGFNHVLEAVRQIRGTSTCQVEGASVALVAAAAVVPTSALLLRK